MQDIKQIVNDLKEDEIPFRIPVRPTFPAISLISIITYASNAFIKGNNLYIDITPKSLSYCNDEVYEKLSPVKHQWATKNSDDLFF